MTTLRHKRLAHFNGALAACATLTAGVVWTLNAYNASGEGLFFFVPLSYLAGWTLTRLWAWYRSTPAD